MLFQLCIRFFISLNNTTTIIIPTYIYQVIWLQISTELAGNATVGVNSWSVWNTKNASSVDITDAKIVIEGNIQEDSKEIEPLPQRQVRPKASEIIIVNHLRAAFRLWRFSISIQDAQGNAFVTDCGEYKINVTNDAVEQTSNAVVSQETSGASRVVQLGNGRTIGHYHYNCGSFIY